MKLRFLAPVLLCASFLTPATTLAAGSNDGQVLSTAAFRLGHQKAATVLAWLRAQPAVLRVWRGSGDSGVTVVFKDGRRSEILSSLRSSRFAPVKLPKFVRPLSVPHLPSSARALVLEPFATELGIGSHAGDPVVSALKSAGFQVDQAYDTAVTISTMDTLSQYNVVYMQTHTGLDEGGILATGELASCGAGSSGDVVVVAVDGSTQCYYGITGQYITDHDSSFAPHSFLFINGCALLDSTAFYGALSAKGAGAMVSWDNLSRTYDDFLSAAAFFNEMDQGQSISGALNALYAAGYGTSNNQGQVAKLGYRGDGGITLTEAANSSPPSATPTSSPVPTSTPAPSVTSTPIQVEATPIATPSPTTAPTSTSTSAPTATATATTIAAGNTPAASLKPSVRPGHKQKVVVVGADPNSQVMLRVLFPNGASMRRTGVATAQGYARLVFPQPRNHITHTDHVAVVTVQVVHVGAVMTLTDRYLIGYAPIDVWSQPSVAVRGQPETIWVHTHSRRWVHVVLTPRRGSLLKLQGRTGHLGWVHLGFMVPKAWGRHDTIHVSATSTWPHRLVGTTVKFVTR